MRYSLKDLMLVSTFVMFVLVLFGREYAHKQALRRVFDSGVQHGRTEERRLMIEHASWTEWRRRVVREEERLGGLALSGESAEPDPALGQRFARGYDEANWIWPSSPQAAWRAMGLYAIGLEHYP